MFSKPRRSTALQTHGRTVFLSACFVGMTAVIFTFYGFASDVKRVHVIDDGVPQEMETRSTDVKELLDEENILLGEHDAVSLPLDHQLQHNDTILISRAVPVTLMDQGTSYSKMTSADTIADALDEWDVALDQDDQVIPGLNNPITKEMQIEITRIDRVIEEVKEIVPFDTVTREDPDMMKGKSAVIQQGRAGTLLRKVEKRYRNGKLNAVEVIDETIQLKSLDEIVAVGTKEQVAVLSSSSPNVSIVTKDEVTFGVKKIIEDVTLTAYDAGFNSTGKNEGDPMYGITYTGTTVKENHTVAVDPEVIPLHWWMYIEGIGFRKAEDIGSAIKGKIIDLYMKTEEIANRFGRQKGYTVYVIGPHKPAGIEE